MANGRVITGYSKPYVALYNPNDGSPTYSSGQPLARGVSVQVESTTGDAVNFYADNVLAESAGGVFTGATLTMVVDGLKDAARKLIMGLPTATSKQINGADVDIYEYDDRQSIPYVGVGFVVRYMEAGVTTYQPVIFTKGAFNVDGLSAQTQEDNLQFQTSELTVNVMRDDSAHHTWRRIAEAQTTEQAAENIVRDLLGIATTI